MIGFSIRKRSRRSRARLGILKTPHGEVETPSLVPVATNATIKTLRSDEVLETGAQLLISNTYHLHLRPGENVLKQAGGINKFMRWPKPTMTDSGGFQVFSLGFGRDFGVGKVGGIFPGKIERAIEKGNQPKFLKITREGVRFKSPIDGRELFLGPRESIAIQEKIGADIMFAFDECTPPGATREYIEHALHRTHAWARTCLEARKSKQALYGIVQGSHFRDLRESSARFINAQEGFDGFGIGGDLGESKTGTRNVLQWVLPLLDEKKPRHLLGIGRIEDIELIIKEGVDTFDCTVPTHYARRGIAFVSPRAARKESSQSRLDLNKIFFLKDQKPLDRACGCLVCQTYSRSYIAHLIRAREITGGALLTFHNLYFFNQYVAKVREKIKKGLI
ncbi:MAG: tRNA guanosine(34) transglycosylase Tgt [Patescibacteria group bacterium]|nr:tRNA guanosine(34) transglycosylase Tgt [Patescibacteria group bacterium]